MSTSTLETRIGRLVIQRRPLQIGERLPIETAYQRKPDEALFLEIDPQGEVRWVRVEGGLEKKLKAGAVHETVNLTLGQNLLQQRVITR